MFRTCHAYISGVEGDRLQWLTPLRSDRPCRWTIFPGYQRWELISYSSHCIHNYQRQLCSLSQFPRHWSIAFFSVFVHRGSQTVRREPWDTIRRNVNNAVVMYIFLFTFSYFARCLSPLRWPTCPFSRESNNYWLPQRFCGKELSFM
jgi:hypothetical protein